MVGDDGTSTPLISTISIYLRSFFFGQHFRPVFFQSVLSIGLVSISPSFGPCGRSLCLRLSIARLFDRAASIDLSVSQLVGNSVGIMPFPLFAYLGRDGSDSLGVVGTTTVSTPTILTISFYFRPFFSISTFGRSFRSVFSSGPFGRPFRRRSFHLPSVYMHRLIFRSVSIFDRSFRL